MGKIRGNRGAEETAFKLRGSEERIFYAGGGGERDFLKPTKPVRNEKIIER